MEKNNFSLLRSKEIIAILDGDKDFGELTFEDKYGNEIAFMNPVYIENKEMYETWKKTMQEIENSYIEMKQPTHGLAER